jgi:hypothetical protein
VIEKTIILIIGFIFGAVFLRIWDELVTRIKLQQYLREMAEKRLRISVKDQ